MRFGVNYTPRRGWFHSWLDLDLGQVREDFDQIAGLGLDHVRIFPLWPVLQPNRTLVRPRALRDVVAVAEVAGQAGLQVSIDALNGHLSSYDFVPNWLTSWHAADIFTDPRAIDGQRLLVRELANAVRDLPNVSGMTLGNEFAQFARVDHPYASATDVAGSDAWLGAMFAELDAVWPAGHHQHSHDDSVWFSEQMPFTPRQAVTLGQITTVHSWVFVNHGPLVGADHPSLALFARYLCEVAAAWSPDPERRIWLQEVGASRPWVSDQHAPDFLRNTVINAAAMPEVAAITWWCSHDVSPDLADFPELEYSLGLFTSDGRPKPEAEALADLVKHPPPVHLVERPAWVFDADWATGLGRSTTAPDREVLRLWMEQASSGLIPALVRAEQSEDVELLDRRGITELLG